MDEHDPFLPTRFASRSVPRRKVEEDEATDQLVAAILDWADTTDHDRDDLDRWLRRLVTGRDLSSPESATVHRVRLVGGPWTSITSWIRLILADIRAARDEA